jgi:hypothetical protein
MALGANFINARNAEVDRNRRIRSENREAYKAFVDMQKESGGRVDPEEFNRFARSLGTSAYTAGGLPSQSAREGTAKAINAEVAAREVARANAARAAEISRAQAELGVVETLAKRLSSTNVDLTSEEGQTQLGQLAKTMGVNDISAYTPLLPVIQTESLNAQVLSTMTTLNELGLNTEAAAGVFTDSLPQRVRDGVNSALRSGENQRKRDAETTRIAGLNLSEIYTNSGQNTADAIRLAEATLGSSLSTEGRAQLELGFSALERGAAVSGVTATVVGLASLPPGQLAPYANDRAALEGFARQQLSANGISNPSPDQVATVMASLEPLARSGSYSAAVAEADTVRSILMKTDAASLSIIESPTDAEAWVSQQLAGAGYSLSQLPADVRRGLVSDTFRMANAARSQATNASEAEYSRMLAGVTEGSAVAGEFMESMLSNIDAGDEARFESMNVFRDTLGLAPYESMQDPAFIQDYRTLDGLIRREVRAKNEARTAAAQQYATDQVSRYSPESQRKQLETTVGGMGYEFESALGRTALRLDQLFYFGARDHFSIVNDLAGYLEDNPAVAARIEAGGSDGMAAVDEVARLIGAASGLVPPSAATAYEMTQYAAASGGADWETVPPGQRVPTYLNSQATQVIGVIDSKIAAINALPADADPAQIAAIMADVPETTREVMREMRVAMSEGGLRYVLDYSGTREAPLQVYLTSFEQQIETALQRLDSAVPQGQRLGLIDNGDGTVTLEDGNAYGRPAGVYTSEQSLTGRLQAGEAISVAPTMSIFVDPAASPFMQGIQGLRGDAQLTRSLNEARTRLATGGFGPAASPAAQALNFFRPTDPERNAQMAINGAAMEFLSTPAARGFLSANPDTLQLLDQDPVSWVRLAQTGSAAPSRTQSIIAP